MELHVNTVVFAAVLVAVIGTARGVEVLLSPSDQRAATTATISDTGKNARSSTESKSATTAGYSSPPVEPPFTVRDGTNYSAVNQTPPVGNLPPSLRAEPEWSNRILLNFTLFPIYLENVDVRLATCQIHFYAVKEWQDKRLAWDTKKYGMNGGVRVSAKKIWTPDFEPYNGLRSTPPTAQDDSVMVSPEGRVRMARPYILTIPVRRSQGMFLPACEIRFASWTSHRLELSGDKVIDQSRFMPCGQWEFKREASKKIYKAGLLEVRVTLIYRLRTEQPQFT